jgi:hypothetical protein
MYYRYKVVHRLYFPHYHLSVLFFCLSLGNYIYYQIQKKDLPPYIILAKEMEFPGY